jgi:hypothetical protein
VRSYGWGAVLLLLGSCTSPAKGPGKASALPSETVAALPLQASEDAHAFTARKDGTALRTVFKGSAELAVNITDLHLGPNQSTELQPKGGALCEVREGRAQVRAAENRLIVGAGEFFAVSESAPASITNAGPGPLHVHVIAVQAP